MVNSKVTVILPTYNCSIPLEFSIKSVLNQDFEDFELLVVGDHCTDNSEEVVKAQQDPRIHWFNLPERVGNQSGPNNWGWKQAKGQYIAYQGHDDLWFPWHLSNLVKILDSGKGLAASLLAEVLPSGVVYVGERNKDVQYGVTYPESFMHRKSIHEIIGDWEENPRQIETAIDRQFIHRIFEANIPYGETEELSVIKFPAPQWRPYQSTTYPQAEYYKRLIDDPVSLQNELANKCLIEAAKKYIQELPFRYALKKKILKTIRPIDPFAKKRNFRTQRKIVKNSLNPRGLS